MMSTTVSFSPLEEGLLCGLLDQTWSFQRSGIRIGDIRIIYRCEGFSFLFNISLPADDPVNEGRVPPGFEPLDFEQVKLDLEKKIVYGRRHHLASSSLRNVGGVDSS